MTPTNLLAADAAVRTQWSGRCSSKNLEWKERTTPRPCLGEEKDENWRRTGKLMSACAWKQQGQDSQSVCGKHSTLLESIVSTAKGGAGRRTARTVPSGQPAPPHTARSVMPDGPVGAHTLWSAAAPSGVETKHWRNSFWGFDRYQCSLKITLFQSWKN